MRPRATAALGNIRPALPALELGSTFSKKGRCAFLFVLGRGAERKQRSLDEQAFIQACFQSLVHRFDGELHAYWGVRNDLLQDGLSPRDQVGIRNDLVYQADAIGFLCADDVSGKNELQSPALPNQPGKTLRAAIAGHDSYFHFGS